MSTDLYIHQNLPWKQGGPVLFTFHGTGGDELQFTGFAKRLAPEATIVSPRGDVSEHGAARFFKRTGEGVYDMADLARATERMVRFIEAHVRKLDASSVAGLGYSNGANILASVIFARPDLFDRAVLMHPLIPFDPRIEGSLTGKSILITAGRRDPICPPALITRLQASLVSAGAEVTTDWHEGGHDIRQNEIEAIEHFFARQPSKEKSDV